ncbi:hypothetical protein LTR05_004532 [Lithohypha guttulata]|uniref:NACHT domain-containing protein n=1 Tax=Lithohypha guttulata TaxID=1690604 RepID=A0AAN7SYS8_9EURO|nr:hypothetical protein LTR05_004532 [Lithohypha guttulata]
MEALAALSLACNVLTVIDSSVKLCKGLRAVYDTNGGTAENQDLQKSSAELRRITESLDNSIKPANSSNTLSKHETELLGIAKDCDNIAGELQNFTLPFTTITRRRDRIRLTWKAVFKDKKEVERLQQQLSQYQQHLQTELLVNILNQHKVSDLERTEDAAQHLDALKRLIDSSTSNHNHLSSLIAQQIARINDHTSQVIQSAQKYDHEARLLEQLLKSLRSSGMNQRENTIVGNHPGTLRWIFADPPSENMASTDTKPSFDSPSAWLEQDTTIYWISGKPGSGKSVLMKSISTSPEALRSLQIWSGGHDVLILRHYFWLAGSEAQKSLKGLFASLLHQVFQQRKSIISTILQRKSAESKIEFSDWSVQELELIVQESLCYISDYVCVFVDGLDEMASKEDIDEALRFIKHIATKQHIKICVSSRPWHRFFAAFDQVPCLHMHDLNKPDVFQYVREKLEPLEKEYGTPQLDGISASEGTLESFTDYIVERAEGVFLWAVIVLGQIREGFINHDTWKVLFERVDTYPSELNDLYENIWRNMNNEVPSYLAEASLYFDFVRSDWTSCMVLVLEPTILLMALFADEKMQTALPTDLTKVSCELLARQCEKTIRHVRTRCAGLLELRPSSSLSLTSLCDGYKKLESYENRCFSFVHRSAIDFLEDHDFGQKLGTAHQHESLDLCHRMVSAISAWDSLQEYSEHVSILDELPAILSSKGFAELDKATKVALVDKIRVTWAVMLSTKRSIDNGRIYYTAKDSSHNTMYQTTSLSLPHPAGRTDQDFLAWTICKFGIDYAEHVLSELKNKISERYIQFLVKIVMLASTADCTIDDCALTCLLSYMPDLNFNFAESPLTTKRPRPLPATLLSCLTTKWSSRLKYPGIYSMEEVRSTLTPIALNLSKIVKTLWSAGYTFKRRSAIRIAWDGGHCLEFDSWIEVGTANTPSSGSILLEISDEYLLKIMLECLGMADLPLGLQEQVRSSSSRFSVRPLLANKAEHTRPRGLLFNVPIHHVSPTETCQQNFEKILTEHVQRYSYAVPKACELKTWFESVYSAGTHVVDVVSYMRKVGVKWMPDDPDIPDVLCRPPPMFKDESELECHSKSRIRGEHDETALSDDDECFEDAVSELMDS